MAKIPVPPSTAMVNNASIGRNQEVHRAKQRSNNPKKRQTSQFERMTVLVVTIAYSHSFPLVEFACGSQRNHTFSLKDE